MSIGFSLITIQNEMRIDNQSIFEQVNINKFILIHMYIYIYFSFYVDRRNNFLYIQKKKEGELSFSPPFFFLITYMTNMLRDK